MTRTRNQTADDLIPMTGVSPRQALAAARALLATRPGPREASIARQAAAIVLRDFGDVGAPIREFRLAARLARAAAEPDREADVLTSLGTALVMAGRTEAGLAALDEALALAASGAARGRILVRRGGSLHIAGRYDEARADLRKAITLTRRSGEVLWEARARTAAALADLAVGATARAEAGFLAAESLFAGTGQRLEIAYARQNRALVAFASGDLPAALRHLDDAAARYAELGVAVPDAALDRCVVLLAAVLPADALAGVEAALAGRVAATKQAELRLAAARIALAAGHPDQGAERARVARSMFAAQHRQWWRTHATFVLRQARLAAGQAAGRGQAHRGPAGRAALGRGPGRLAAGGGSACSRSTWVCWAPPTTARVLAPVGADELLGLASALLPLGTAGIVASVAQVNDRAAAPLMLALHRRLRSAGPGAAPSPPHCATPAPTPATPPPATR
jgi:tetratricopeptide (TPR) repeat protein